MCHHDRSRLRRIAILVFDGARTLDITGPLEVFDVARALGCAYSVSIYSTTDARTIRCSSGLRVDSEPATAMPPSINTLLVPGSDSWATDPVPQHVTEYLDRHAAMITRVAAVCTGSFALGAAGMLEGRRATTHWRHQEAFAARYPNAIIEPDSVYVRDEHIWTSAGAAAGIDLALALVADDHGTDVAADIAKELVLLSRRMEGHPQISVAARTPRPKHPELERLMATINADPAAHYELDAVAVQVGLSPRHLARLFKAQVGMTLRQYVYEVRLENAVSLVLSGESFHAAARRSGLRYGVAVRDHLAAHHALPRADLSGSLVDTGGTEPAAVYAG